MRSQSRHHHRRAAAPPRGRAAAVAAAVLACGTLLGLAAPASSDTEPAPSGLATLAPSNAGAPSHLQVNAQGSGGGLESNKVPGSLELAFQTGFTIDPKAVPGVCTNSDVSNKQCPANSRFATGSIDLTAHGTAFGSGQNFTAQVSLYVGEPQQPGDPAGAVFYYVEPSSGFHDAFPGRIDTLSDPTYGTEIRFDHLSLPPLPPGYTFDLHSLKLDIGYGGGTPTPTPGTSGSSGSSGSSGTGTGRHSRKRHHKHSRRHVFVIRHHAPRHAPATAATARAVAHLASASFLTNPTTCSGTWDVRLELGYSDGVQERDAAAPCTS